MFHLQGNKKNYRGYMTRENNFQSTFQTCYNQIADIDSKVIKGGQ